jgi:[acyl-carrier-protein] S-malonyltransferase
MAPDGLYDGLSMFIAFTGQGSQFVGMGSSFTAHKAMSDVMAEVDDALSEHLSRTILSGDAAELMLTENAQPAIMCVSVGIFRVVQAEFGLAPQCAAGHSVGEYSALVASGAMKLADAARLLRIRGRAMQAACPLGYGSMAAILGLECAQVHNALEGLLCYVANDNGGGQVVISGERGAVAEAIQRLKSAGAKRAIALDVSAPFHTPLLKEAEQPLFEALQGVELSLTNFPIISNVTVEPYRSTEEIRNLLVQQITGTVRWRETVIKAASTTKEFVEIGPAPVLSKIATRTDPSLNAISVCCEADLTKLERQ